ncbi:hypothetical protein BST61_g11551 [Cercospora zeina]
MLLHCRSFHVYILPKSFLHTQSDVAVIYANNESLTLRYDLSTCICIFCTSWEATLLHSVRLCSRHRKLSSNLHW